MNYLNQCPYSRKLTEKLILLDKNKTLNFRLIKKAIFWAIKYHGQQKRKTGHPFYSHPLEVAYTIADYILKTDVIIASILHDIVEDTIVTTGMILDNFNPRIVEMVEMLTRDKKDGTKISVLELLNEAFEKKDYEVLIIKVIDRIDNLKSIGIFDIEKQNKMKQKTLNDFLPFILHIENDKFLRIIVSRCLQLKKTPDYNSLELKHKVLKLTVI